LPVSGKRSGGANRENIGAKQSRRSETSAYRTEKALVDHFLEVLNVLPSPWGSIRTAREFFYQRGRTDVIALAEDGKIIAFEAKLRRWREALHQAYRNTCFAHTSYVLLPKRLAVNLQKHVSEFRARGVGLCYLCSDHGLVVLFEANESRPLEPWLTSRAALEVGKETIGCK
jgi:hypothetical protein